MKLFSIRSKKIKRVSNGDLSLGDLFIKGFGDPYAIHPNDVDQETYQTCFLLAPLAAIVNVSSKTIYKLIKPLKNGDYQVRLFNDKTKRWDRVVVTQDELKEIHIDPKRAQYGDRGEKWVVIIEKAYANWYDHYNINEEEWSLKEEKQGKPGQNNYTLIKAGYFEYAFEHITGKKPQKFHGKAITHELLVKAFKDKRPVVASSFAKPTSDNQLYFGPNKSLSLSHAYYMIHYDTKHKQVHLRNPWGWHRGIIKMPLGLFIDNFNRIAIGRIK